MATVNIKIVEKAKGWSLWVTELPGDDQPPIYTASGRTREQILSLAEVILTEQGSAVEQPPKAAFKAPLGARDMRKVAQSQVLYTMLCTLDDWIRGAKENHEALGHRNENRGEECWRQFAPDDIRRMVNDVARESGLSEFPLPQHVQEDAAP